MSDQGNHSDRSVRDRLADSLITVPNQLYSGPVERIATAVGIEPLLERAYVRVFTALRDDTVELSVGGYTATFSVDNPIEHRRLTGRLQEINRPILTSLLAEVDPTDVVWDVGAHLGRYSCFLGQIIEPGNLVAIEAHPANAESLERNLSHNGIEATVIRKALTDATTAVEFTLEHDKAGEFIRGAEYTEDTTDASERTIKVETVAGETLTTENGYPRPTVIRIDVAGGEPQALDGMADLLADERCRLAYVTLYRDRYDRPDAVELRLRKHGFEMTTLDDRWLKAQRP